MIFDISERERRFRDQLRRNLIQFGFGQLQESILICPVNRFNFIQKSVFYEQMKPYLIYLKIDEVYGFNREKLVSKCWNLESIRKEYEKFVTVQGKRIQHFLLSSKGWAQKERKVASRWLLLMIKDELAKLLRRHPPLPREFVLNQLPFDELMSGYRAWTKKLA